MDEAVRLTEAVKQKVGEPASFPLNAPLYNSRGDSIAIYFNDVEMYSVLVDDILTIYRAAENNEIVGCKLCNVSILAENVKSIVHVDDDDVYIKFLLLSAAGTKPERKYYIPVSNLLGDMKIKRNQMAHAQ